MWAPKGLISGYLALDCNNSVLLVIWTMLTIIYFGYNYDERNSIKWKCVALKNIFLGLLNGSVKRIQLYYYSEII